MISDIGRYHHQTVEIVAKGPVELNNELLREAGMRFIEEAVELALATGLSAQEVLVHVADAIHNEAHKIKKYPSEMGATLNPHRGNLKVEIIDAIICADYIRFVAGIEIYNIMPAMDEKLELLRLRALSDDYVMVGKRIYKKEART